ncbi:MAG TPA: hypothetical protein VER36_05515 [Flavisolibacter sp.]|nr:hypothetical protein [Flavisolibacter sp.]
MASTSLQVLYFRSLKVSNVLNHLTRYLLQYKAVTIPNVGTMQIVQHPPQLNVVDKLILPPSYSVELRKGEEVSDHQLNFLNGFLNKDKNEILSDLYFLGDKLHQKMAGPGFEWNGLGTITSNTLMLPLTTEALGSVPAERVIRHDARHKVLVGDEQRLSGQAPEFVTETSQAKSKHSIYVLIGWILLLLSLIAIVFLLYTGKFRINATGSKASALGHEIRSAVLQKT